MTSEIFVSLARKHFPRADARALAEKMANWCGTNACRIISGSDPKLDRLRESGAAPDLLFVLGEPEVLPCPAVAVVGTRRPSLYGRRAAVALSSSLARRGLAIVSGLARGIDAAAHRGALAAGGTTIAVVAHGLDGLYPAENRGLAREIVAKGGAIVSEYPPFVAPHRPHFPARNRIIAGLTLGTAVVEAAERSGSLITARFACDFNREVFVVPGSFDESSFLGSHRLVQAGAKLVTCADDVLGELEGSFAPRATSPPDPSSPATRTEQIFRAAGGVISLDRWREEGEETSLARLVRAGLVVEVLPQQFAWIGER